MECSAAQVDLVEFPIIAQETPSFESRERERQSPHSHERKVCRQQTLVLPAEPHLSSSHLLDLPSPMDSTPTETPRPVSTPQSDQPHSARTQDGKSSNSSGVSSVEEALPLIDTLLQWIQDLMLAPPHTHTSPPDLLHTHTPTCHEYANTQMHLHIKTNAKMQLASVPHTHCANTHKHTQTHKTCLLNTHFSAGTKMTNLDREQINVQPPVQNRSVSLRSADLYASTSCDAQLY